MFDRDKVIYSIERCVCNVNDVCRDCAYYDAGHPYIKCVEMLLRDAMKLLKEQEQEISRLKHHVDCDAAEKLPSGCVGYGRGLNDDEPCETCKACEKYNGYGEE